jgi:DNA-binding CsgD family transcriptional regulator
VASADRREAAIEHAAVAIGDGLGVGCMIGLLDDGGSACVRPLWIHHPVPERLAVLEQLYDMRFERTHGFVGEALRTSSGQWVEPAPGDVARLWPSLTGLMSRCVLTSLIVVPLRGAGSVLGAVWAGRSKGEPPLTGADLQFVEDAARVIGAKVEGAMLAEARERPGDGPGRSHAQSGGRPDPESPLTAREIEVLELLALGHTNRETAANLHLSVRTVEWHRARVQWKLGASGRADLVRAARERGVLVLGDEG